jgi:hypothetical protein
MSLCKKWWLQVKEEIQTIISKMPSTPIQITLSKE